MQFAFVRGCAHLSQLVVPLVKGWFRDPGSLTGEVEKDIPMTDSVVSCSRERHSVHGGACSCRLGD